MIENDIQEPLETYHVYIWKEEEPETIVDSTLVKPQQRDNHGAIMMLISTIVMGLIAALAPSTPISQQISIMHTFPLTDLRSYALLPVTSSQSITVAATGKGHQDAKQAHGTITFFNGLFTGQTIAQGTILTGADGVQVVTDQDAFIPAANPPVFGQASVPAHAIHAGAAGNITSYSINQVCCATAVKVLNANDFIGGRDARNFPVVAQKDIEGGALPLTQSLYSKEQKALHAGPDATVIPLPCTSTVITNHRAGEEAARVTIHVSATCSAITYSQKSLQEKAQRLVPIPPGFLLKAMSFHVVRTKSTSVTVLIQYTMLYDFTKGKGTKWAN